VTSGHSRLRGQPAHLTGGQVAGSTAFVHVSSLHRLKLWGSGPHGLQGHISAHSPISRIDRERPSGWSTGAGGAPSRLVNPPTYETCPGRPQLATRPRRERQPAMLRRQATAHPSPFPLRKLAYLLGVPRGPVPRPVTQGPVHGHRKRPPSKAPPRRTPSSARKKRRSPNTPTGHRYVHSCRACRW
jgi:hypothetical protein